MAPKPPRERKQERKQEQKQGGNQTDAEIIASLPSVLPQLTREPGTYNLSTSQKPFTGIPELIRVND